MSRRLILCIVTLVSLGAFASVARAARLVQVGTFSSPVFVTAPPGDVHRLMVVEQGGTIRELVDGVPAAGAWLDIHTLVKSGGEQGLLSMAFAPDYAGSGHFYVYSTTAAAGDIAIDEFRVSDPDHADAASRRRVLTIGHDQEGNHNGGQLQFGPDGMLYIGTGDGGGGGDTHHNAQNLTEVNPATEHTPLLGKLLRIDPKRGAGCGGGCTIPAGNPFPAPAAEVWALGLRNPWRFSFDRLTGDLTIGDVGQGAWEEVDFDPARAPGRNYGWNLREGLHSYPGDDPLGPNCCTSPVLEHSHSDSWAAIVGGYVVRDPAVPELAGRYVYGDNEKGQLYAATLAVPSATGDAPLGLSVPGLSSMGEDACGRVYAALLGGAVYRLSPAGAEPTCTASPPFGGGAGGGGTPGGGGGGGGPVVAPDRVAPRLMLDARRRQHVLRTTRVRIGVSCNERCTVTLSAAGARGIARTLAAGARVRLELRLNRARRRSIRRRLAHGKPVVLAIHVRAVDDAKNAVSKTIHVRVLHEQ